MTLTLTRPLQNSLTRPLQNMTWARGQVIFHTFMRNQDVAIYSLWVCLLSENWVNVMTPQEQNPGNATCPLTQTTSALGHMATQVLMATCGRGKTEA